EEVLALRFGEDAGRRADGADAAGAEGAGDAQALLRLEAVQQPVDVTGVEGVAAAAGVDVGHGVDAGAQPDPLATAPPAPAPPRAAPAARRWRRTGARSAAP